jgi:REP element-mobilizing transposase RayT
MARPLRIEFFGAIYHVTACGNAREAVFRDDADRDLFLDALGEVVARFGWFLHAYCLMDNHYHLLIETPQGNLSPAWPELKGQVLLRSEAFVAKMRPLLEDMGELTEIPRAQRWAHRPGLKSLFSARVRQDKPAHDAAMRRACLEYGDTMAAVAREAGIHPYSTVSKIIKEER